MRLEHDAGANGTQPSRRVGSRMFQFDPGARTVHLRNEVIGIFNPHVVGLRQFRQMLLYPMIQFGLGIRRSAIINLRWKVESRDPEIKAGLTEEMNRLYRPFALAASNAIGLGNVVIEPVYHVEDLKFDVEDDRGEAKEVVLPDAWRIRRTKNIRPETIKFLLEDDEIAGVEQNLGGNRERVGIDEIVVWSYRKEDVYGDPRGAALLRAVYEPWWNALSALLFGNRWLERKGEGVWKARAQRDLVRSDGTIEDGYQTMGEAIEQFRNDSLLVLPTIVDEFGNFLFDFELIESQDRTEVFQGWIDARELSMLRGLLVMGNAATSSEGEGSRAMAETHERTMEGPLETDVNEFLDDVLNPQLVIPWGRQNWGRERFDDSHTRITSGGISGATKEIFRTVVEKVLELDVVVAEGETINLAESLDLKEMAKELGLTLKSAQELRDLLAAKAEARKQATEEFQSRSALEPDDEEINDREAREALIRRGQAPEDDE